MSADLVQLVTSLAQRARAAALGLATAPTTAKNAALMQLATLIDAAHPALLAANAQDLASPEAAALAPAARDRLTLNSARLQHLAESVREVAALPDPVGDVLEEFTRPNGLHIRKLRVPIGVIGIIYEARPNVRSTAPMLCLKSGNACILRGGKECFHTNTAFVALITQALRRPGLSRRCRAARPHHRSRRVAHAAEARLPHPLHHPARRRESHPLRRGKLHHPRHQALQAACASSTLDAAADLAMAEAITRQRQGQPAPVRATPPSNCSCTASIADKFLPGRRPRARRAKKSSLRCDAASAAILVRENLRTRPRRDADYHHGVSRLHHRGPRGRFARRPPSPPSIATAPITATRS